MGSSESKTVTKEVVKTVYANTDEANTALALCQLENKTKELQAEVQNIKQEFPDKDIIRTLATTQDVLVLRYKELEETSKILKNVSQIFAKFPGSSFINETAQKLVLTMRSTDELKEIIRWQSNKVVRNVDGQVYGIEVHYKLNMMEDIKKHYISKDQKDTILIVAYKCITHTMNASVTDVPSEASWEKLKAIKF